LARLKPIERLGGGYILARLAHKSISMNREKDPGKDFGKVCSLHYKNFMT
jgi:hypothetical protein